MVVPAEHLYDNCSACEAGMVGGERCPTCGGRGIVRRPPEAIAVIAERLEAEEKARLAEPRDATPSEPEAPAMPNLKRLNLATLQGLAEERGLDPSGTKADIIERLEAEPEPDPEPEANASPES